MVLKAHPTDPDKLIFDNKDRVELLNALSAPPQRKWQGLTDDEIELDWQFMHDEEGNPPDQCDFARAIEAKLREKNA